jgi:3-oxoacyl-[acyl-carrier protein] reductase
MGDRLNDKVAIVTGGGRGLGKAFCLALAKEGANVVLSDVDMEPAGEVVKEIEKLGGKAAAVKADVRSKGDVEGMLNAAVSNFGGVDTLVNNAGITRDLPMRKMEEKDWDDVIDICLKGSFVCTQLISGYMTRQARKEKEEGKEVPCRKIINVTSGAGIRGNAGQTNYSSAKAGIMGLTKASAKELARNNITVNAICPAALTRMTEEMIEALIQRIPMGRLGDPEKDIAPLVVFLASDDANYITGQVIPVNGGMDMAI